MEAAPGKHERHSTDGVADQCDVISVPEVASMLSLASYSDG